MFLQEVQFIIIKAETGLPVITELMDARELDKLYTLENMTQIVRYVKDNNITLPEFINEVEEDDFDEYMERI